MNIRNLLVQSLQSLQSLSHSELQHFDKFLRSPYFRKEHFNNSKVYELFKILKLYFYRFPENKDHSPQHVRIVNWEKVLNKVLPAPSCPEEKQKKLNKICSELIYCILDFFAVERFQSRKVDFRIFTAEEIEKRNLSDLFEHNWKVKYFDGIYSEDEVTNIYHRYRLIKIANIHKEKCKGLCPDYELELMLFKKYKDKVISELEENRKLRNLNVSKLKE